MIKAKRLAQSPRLPANRSTHRKGSFTMDADFAEPARQSLLAFYYYALGIKYILLLPMSALFGFVLTLLLVLRGKSPFLVPALLFAVSMPLLVGVYGVVDGLIQSMQVIAASTASPKPSELAQCYSLSLVSAQVGMILAVPSYLTAIVGTIIRSVLTTQPKS
jgi:hypothetical protein